jgi:hypothetical protein
LMRLIMGANLGAMCYRAEHAWQEEARVRRGLYLLRPCRRVPRWRASPELSRAVAGFSLAGFRPRRKAGSPRSQRAHQDGGQRQAAGSAR